MITKGIIDTMIGFPDPKVYERLSKSLGNESTDAKSPVDYMFKSSPKDLYNSSDPVSVTLNEMDRFGIELGVITIDGDISREAIRNHPDRFIAQGTIDPNRGMDGVRRMIQQYEEFGVRSFSGMNALFKPRVSIDDPLMYPIYAKCVELDVPIFLCAGVPGPRLPMAPQRVELIDQVMYDFPELVMVTRHGCEPWEDLAVKLMVKWPNLYYSTSAFAPKFYPKAIIDYANTRGADKVIYGGYFPMGMTMERIMNEMQNVPLKEEVWPKFLRDNSRKVLKLDQQ
ncbi:MAG: amidohydrolase family protein [Opitutales bacterium]|jgi:uncharacterized protein|nr:amidohydrolase family protein [Opitutales bacterium]